jgi:hypothetical protein
MRQLQNLEIQLKNLKVTFNEGLANQDVSIEELRKIRTQINDLEQLILDRKVFLKRQDSTN